MDLSIYKNIILDFDGVVIDSNKIKENAITKVAKKYLDSKDAIDFVNYFISNNGLPREIKIEKYLDSKVSQLALFDYNEILKTELVFANFTNGFDSFLGYLQSFNLVPSILSGGDELEIINFLKKKDYLSKFKRIMGGPKTKINNLRSLNLSTKCLFIGDSKVDYDAAQKFNFDFIFMYGYTQFSSWETFFTENKIIRCIKDFSELLSQMNLEMGNCKSRVFE